MNSPDRHDNQLIDLLIKEATEGLTAEERAELTPQTRRSPNVDARFAEDTIAALSVALVGKRERMPAGLRDRILAAAANSSDAVDIDSARERRNRNNNLKQSAATSTAGWWTAAAAFVLAIAGWWPRLAPQPEQDQVAASRTPVEIRQELLTSGHAIRASWSPADAAAGEPLTGDVVFDPVTQRGFLTFRGIPTNDPRLAQYQLWIVDARRKHPEPIDGGVFNVTGTPTTSGNDVVIPFEAKLPVGQAAAFVVTMEEPGGVVISKQEKVLALAKVTT